MATNPGRLLNTLLAYTRSDALRAAIELGIFAALDDRAATPAQLARACNADEGLIRRLCDYLAATGILRKRGGGYRSAPDAARFLNPRSPDSFAGVVALFNGPPITTAYRQLAKTVRRGRPWIDAAASSALWARFAETALPLRRFHASGFATALLRARVVQGRILDLGAGASPLGVTLLTRSRGTSLVVQDRPGVVAAALVHARAAGVGDRVRALRGDARRLPLGGPYDLILAVNALDYFDERSRAALLRRAHDALRPGGALAVCAPMLSGSRTAPADAVAYDLLLLALTGYGRASTFEEMTRQLQGAGFRSVRRHKDPPMLLARKR